MGDHDENIDFDRMCEIIALTWPNGYGQFPYACTERRPPMP